MEYQISATLLQKPSTKTFIQIVRADGSIAYLENGGIAQILPETTVRAICMDVGSVSVPGYMVIPREKICHK